MELVQTLFSFQTLLSVFSGTLLGIVIGLLPGLNGPIGVALLLPFTFSMDVTNALLLLGGLYMGSSYGGSISAILLNAPGTEVAAATALEGYPMARSGKAEEALSLSLIASSLGGLFGAVVMLSSTPLLARLALHFGPPEMALLAFAGLAIIGMLSGRDIWLGLSAGAFGILLSTIGQDLMLGQIRNNFGIFELQAGVSLVPVLVGLFAVSEVISWLLRPAAAASFHQLAEHAVFSDVLRNVLKRFRGPLCKGSLIGVFIGIMPGAGAAIATFIAYGEARRSSKHPERFGTGAPEGIVAAESANNSAVCGSLVPLLALGIPGSVTCAIMYGALTLHGIIPGPRLLQTSGEFAYTFMWGMLLTVFFMFCIGRAGMPLFAKVLRLPTRILMPCIFILCLIGAFSINNSLFDVLLAIIFGLMGYLFKLARIPVAPVVLGLILGPICEEGVRQSLLMASAHGGSLLDLLLGRPASLCLMVLLGLLCWASVLSAMRTCKLGGTLDE